MGKEEKLNGFLEGFLYLCIGLGGPYRIVESIKYMVDSPLLGIVSLIITVISIACLIGILALKKWALILWLILACSDVIACLVDEDSLEAVRSFLPVVVLCLLLLLRKNGVSAWSLIFSKKKKEKEEQPAPQQPPQPPFPIEQNNTADNHFNDRMTLKDNTDNEVQRTVDFVKADEVHVYYDGEKEERQAVPETNVTTEELRTEIPADSPLQIKKKCMNCGKELPNDALFCNRCGCKIEPKEECTTEEPKPQPVSVEADNAKENIAGKEEIKSEENITEEKPKKKRDWTLLFILLGLLAIFLGIKGVTLYIKNKNNALLEEYARKRHGLLDRAKVSSPEDKEWNSIFEKSDTSSEEDEMREKMEEIAEECNKDLPEDLGFGLTWNSCKLEGRNMIYSYEWAGMNPSDFTKDDIRDIKSSMIEELQEKSFGMKIIRTAITEYNYRFIYRYYSEDGDMLCEITIASDDL